MSCECLTGFPIELPDGTCVCTGGIRPPIGGSVPDGGPAAPDIRRSKIFANAQTPPPIINNYYQLLPQLAGDNNSQSHPGTIFGFSPLMILGVGALALWAFSAMDTKTEGKK